MGRPVNEDPIIKQNFTKMLNTFLDNSEYNNTTFGKLLNVSETTIRKYRSGEIMPSHTQMKKILSIMKLRYHELLGFEDPKNVTVEGQE